MTISSKLPDIGTTIFSTVSAMAAKHQAVNLSQGFPDFQPDPRLLQLLAEASAEGHHQYSPMPGVSILREEISKRITDRDANTYDPDTEITITSGATEALFSICQALIHPGDEIILFSPAYDSYEPGIRLAGGFPVYVPLTFPDFRIDWDRVRQAITSRTKGIFINHPHNPSGATLSSADLMTLSSIAESNDMWICSDEVYDYMVFDGKKHLSAASLPSLRSRTIVVSSFGKTLHTTGWKVGYCLAPASLTKEIRKVHQFVTFSVPTPFQVAIARYLHLYPDMITGLSDFYQTKRDLFLTLLEKTGFEPLKCAGTYFQLATYNSIKNCSDTEFCQWLTKEIKVACIPVSVFYPDKRDHQIVRFCFAKKNETLLRAAELLRSI